MYLIVRVNRSTIGLSLELTLLWILRFPTCFKLLYFPRSIQVKISSNFCCVTVLYSCLYTDNDMYMYLWLINEDDDHDDDENAWRLTARNISAAEKQARVFGHWCCIDDVVQLRKWIHHTRRCIVKNGQESWGSPSKFVLWPPKNKSTILAVIFSQYVPSKCFSPRKKIPLQKYGWLMPGQERAKSW